MTKKEQWTVIANFQKVQNGGPNFRRWKMEDGKSQNQNGREIVIKYSDSTVTNTACVHVHLLDFIPL